MGSSLLHWWSWNETRKRTHVVTICTVFFKLITKHKVPQNYSWWRGKKSSRYIYAEVENWSLNFIEGKDYPVAEKWQKHQQIVEFFALCNSLQWYSGRDVEIWRRLVCTTLYVLIIFNRRCAADVKLRWRRCFRVIYLAELYSIQRLRFCIKRMPIMRPVHY